MKQSEEIPLWETVTHPFASALELAFGCHHRRLSRVFTLEGRSYQVCCDCGATFDYSLEQMSIVHRYWLFAALRHLRAQRRLRRIKLLQRDEALELPALS